MTDPWADVGPEVVTSSLTAFVTTIVTLSATFGVRSLGRRREKGKHPIALRRGSGTYYEVVNESKRPFLEVSAEIINEEKFRNPLGYPGPGLSPQRSLSLGSLVPGDVVRLSWSEYVRGKEQKRWATLVRIREDTEVYRPDLIAEPPILHGG